MPGSLIPPLPGTDRPQVSTNLLALQLSEASLGNTLARTLKSMALRVCAIGSAIAGFSLIDITVTVGLLSLAAAVSFPILTSAMGIYLLRTDTRSVERELQTARAMAVSSNRPIRVRFNCPAQGQFRRVELIGTPSVPDPADSSSSRCSAATYPYPPTDRDPLSLPNLDGPVRRINPQVAFGNVQTIEFWPDGTAHVNTGGTTPWPTIASGGMSLTLVKGSATSTLTVNGLGKIRIQ
jgi:hypothetical protein